MTCIVGIAHKGKVTIGGDSAGVAGLSITDRADEKVFRNGDMSFGFTSSFRMGNLLRYCFVQPKRALYDGDDMGYMVSQFIPAVIKCLTDGGYNKTTNGVHEGGRWLCGYNGTLYFVDTDYQVGIPRKQIAAVGCGDDIALGSLFTSTGAPEDRVRTALKAAETFSAGVRGPFKVLTI